MLSKICLRHLYASAQVIDRATHIAALRSRVDVDTRMIATLTRRGAP